VVVVDLPEKEREGERRREKEREGERRRAGEKEIRREGEEERRNDRGTVEMTAVRVRSSGAVGQWR